MKQTICSIFGVIGSTIATLFGGWDAGLATLLIFMALDYVTGLLRGFSTTAQRQIPGHWKAKPDGKDCAESA